MLTETESQRYQKNDNFLAILKPILSNPFIRMENMAMYFSVFTVQRIKLHKPIYHNLSRHSTAPHALVSAQMGLTVHRCLVIPRQWTGLGEHFII